MLSRVAESIYWMNRYVERAENYARLIDVNFRLTLDLPPGLQEQWRPLILTTGDGDIYQQLYGTWSKDKVIRFMAFDLDNPNSIYSCLSHARENARCVREIIPSELWLQINELYLSVSEVVNTNEWKDEKLSKFFRKIKFASHLFAGIMDATCSHNEGWNFGMLGRFIERADKTARILDMKYYYLLPSVKDVGTSLDILQWCALLRSASAFEMYRKQFGSISIERIVEFLVLDRLFPRSIHYCLIVAEQSLHALLGTDVTTFVTQAEKYLGKARSDLNYTEVADIIGIGLHEYLDSFQTELNNVSAAIHETFFAMQYV